MYNPCLENHDTNLNSNAYTLTAILAEIAHHRFLNQLAINVPVINFCLPTQVLIINVREYRRGNHAINPGNILRHKSAKSKIPTYFKDQSAPIISYAYTTPIPTKIFNYKVLQDLNIDDFKSKPSNCTCACSPFIYNPAGLNIINNISLRDVFIKGVIYREPKSINWKHNFKFL